MCQSIYAQCGELISKVYTKSIHYRELNDDGSALIQEQGRVNGVSLAYKWSVARPFSVALSGSLDSGLLDYDGKTQIGVPLSTTTQYKHQKISVLAAYDNATAFGAFGLYTGIERPFWQRSIQATQLSAAIDVDYEWWQGKLGGYIKNELAKTWSLLVKYDYSTNDVGFLQSEGRAKITLHHAGGQQESASAWAKLNRLDSHTLGIALDKKFSNVWQGGISIERQWDHWQPSDVGVLSGVVPLKLREPESKIQAWYFALRLRKMW
ncbi:MAG TPA: hypothetical protein VIC26_03875 [Marinagarivorans sp.]